MDSAAKSPSLLQKAVLVGLASLLALFAYGFTGLLTTGNPSTPFTEEEIRRRVDSARERWGDVYANRLEEFLNAIPTTPPGGAVFLGDSITHVYELDLIFPDKPYINRGTSGDTIQGLRERLDVCVSALKPSEVYVMIGTNNLWNDSSEAFVDSLMEEYTSLFEELRQHAPEATITIQSILPTRGDWLFRNGLAATVNSRLKPLAQSQGFQWLDVCSLFQDEQGQLREELTFDGIHLNSDGYVLWSNLLHPEIPVSQLYENIAPQWLAFNSRSSAISAINPPVAVNPANPKLPPQIVI